EDPPSSRQVTPSRDPRLERGRPSAVGDAGRRAVPPAAAPVRRGARERVIFSGGNRNFVRHNESQRFFNAGARRQARPDGGSIASVRRRNGTVYSEFDRNGRLIRRYRVQPDGRRFVLIDNRRFYRRGVGIALGLGAAAVVLAPLAYANYQNYIVEYEDADYRQLVYALDEDPVATIPRRYSLEEILSSVSLRERMRRIDIATLRFVEGTARIGSREHRKLRQLARVMSEIIRENPDEVFLIEGHAFDDGSGEDPLELSDQRAEEVAKILSEEFGIPPENLVTQGYGDEFVGRGTRGRYPTRISVRRITPLLEQGSLQGPDDGGQEQPPY
ncbi:MAG: hypothetical protein RLZ98_3832, partial [Pseudomonadota bacterium]